MKDKPKIVALAKELELYDYLKEKSKSDDLNYFFDTIALDGEIEDSIEYMEENSLDTDDVYYDDNLELYEKLKAFSKRLKTI